MWKQNLKITFQVQKDKYKKKFLLYKTIKLEYQGYIKSIQSENIFGKTYGKTTYEI